MALRAVLASAVEAGELRRSAAASIPMPREVVRKPPTKETDAWDDARLDRVLTTVATHRWGGPIRLETLYGLRMSELLAIHARRAAELPLGIRMGATFRGAAGELVAIGGFRAQHPSCAGG